MPLGTKLSKKDEGPTMDFTLYKILVGNMLYITTNRPYILYAVDFVSRFMESSKASHWKMAKRIMIYNIPDIKSMQNKNKMLEMEE
jgi:hypothetical protein